MPRKSKKDENGKEKEDGKKKKIKYLKTKNGRYYRKLPSGLCRFVSKAEVEGGSAGSSSKVK